MKTPSFGTAVAIGLLMAAAAAANAQDAKSGTHSREERVSATATVEAIDLKTRQVTLRSDQGEETTIVVGPEVRRLDEIKVGDRVRADYYIGITAELRAPTPEEAKQPFTVVDDTTLAKEGAAPAAGVARKIRVVATIEALDRLSGTATLKGPEGNYVTVAVKDPKLLEKPHLGDTVVVTTSESLAVSLEKVKDGN